MFIVTISLKTDLIPKEQQDATCKQAKEMFAQVMDQMKKQGLLK